MKVEYQGPGMGNYYGPNARCEVENCGGRPHCRSLCYRHYARWKRLGRPTRPSLAERFEKYVDRSGDCHRWNGTHNSGGYGHFKVNGRMRAAHHVALELAGIRIPEGMTVDHVRARGCLHKDCVRIDHLEVVPGRVNTLRSDNPCAVNARKTHCMRGHKFDAANTLIRRSGGRDCRACARIRRGAAA